MWPAVSPLLISAKINPVSRLCSHDPEIFAERSGKSVLPGRLPFTDARQGRNSGSETALWKVGMREYRYLRRRACDVTEWSHHTPEDFRPNSFPQKGSSA